MSFMESVLDGLFTVPGDGGIDFPAILESLREAGYAGWLVVEAAQDPGKDDPLTFARTGHDNLAAMARDAGFVVEDQKASRSDWLTNCTHWNLTNCPYRWGQYWHN